VYAEIIAKSAGAGVMVGPVRGVGMDRTLVSGVGDGLTKDVSTGVGTGTGDGLGVGLGVGIGTISAVGVGRGVGEGGTITVADKPDKSIESSEVADGPVPTSGTKAGVGVESTRGVGVAAGPS